MRPFFMDYFANRLCSFVSRYIIYAKIFQWLSINSDSKLIKRIFSVFDRFTDNAPYIEDDINFDELDAIESRGISQGNLIKIDRTPINSGTVSLVFKGEIFMDGKFHKVAIKLLRNNIRQRIKDAIIKIEWVLHLTTYIPFVKYFNLEDIFKGAEECLLEQTILTHEKKNITSVYYGMRKYKMYTCVEMLDQFASENSIIMKFVEGQSFRNLTTDQIQEYIKPFVASNFRLNFMKGIVHLDLHPGNILFVEEGKFKKICFLDMGMMMNLTIEEKEFLFALFSFFFVGKNIEHLFNIMDRHSNLIIEESDNYDNLKKILRFEVDHHGMFREQDSAKLIKDIINVLKIFGNSGTKLCPRFNKLIFGILSFISLFLSMDSKGEFISELRDKFKSVM